jgi:hypothetical protein
VSRLELREETYAAAVLDEVETEVTSVQVVVMYRVEMSSD